MRGEYVNVLDKLDDSGWWQGKNEAGHTGVFPSNYVQVLDNQSPPARPMRARPPTIKMESSASVKEGPLSPSLARPPPVPLTTRPTSLLTSRGSPSSDASSTSAARPITTPPRPTTLPPVPSRRFNSTISTDPKKPTGGVPIFAPDLPPITSPIKQRPSQELPDLPPARPTRPVPAPAATTSSVLSTEKSHTENDHPSRPSMAKVPKVCIFFFVFVQSLSFHRCFKTWLPILTMVTAYVEFHGETSARKS
ncbi:uncharacterized protein BYT42DRAFT_142933 [Radiomyces spectabilis]|uniref:uncharacterized protein n=1 Tax=Radiomyces spectabilis TaxID=64574 RepID=UPI00221EFAA4|nr:uncharacterized protein BYT42DRAFT_142933 [Radiomyces spectabilis]KAI8366771.1 hypothetical protein BYT42DRAFT_142933 [Radiomyces spectabilis]